MKLFATFQKFEDEQRMVYGYASTEALDTHGEIVRREALVEALPDFMQFGNIREMHQPSAVGKAKQAKIDGKGLWLGAKIVDDDAWAKVKEGVYSGFSIAGRVTARDPRQPHIITGCTLNEISLVDRPANPEAIFTMYKTDSMDKRGARNSKADLATIQRIHDHAAELGAACPGHAAPDAADPDDDRMGDDMTGDDDTAKLAQGLGGDPFAKLMDRLDRTNQGISRLADECRRLGRRVAELEQAPAPGRGPLRSLTKAQDTGRDDLADRDKSAHDLIKDALRRPNVF